MDGSSLYHLVYPSKEAAATLVTFRDVAGEVYVILTRGDPRYYDFTGQCTLGKKLRLGQYQFPGGHVEADVAPVICPQLHMDSGVHPRVTASALKELHEEISLDVPEFLRRHKLSATMKPVQLSLTSSLPVHFFHLDLGTLPSDACAALFEQVKPADDAMVTTIIAARNLTKFESHIRVQPDMGFSRIKTKFDGYDPSEYEKWLRELKCPITKQSCRFIHETVRGQDGVDTTGWLHDPAYVVPPRHSARHGMHTIISAGKSVNDLFDEIREKAKGLQKPTLDNGEVLECILREQGVKIAPYFSAAARVLERRDQQSATHSLS